MARMLAALLGRESDTLLLHTIATFEKTTGTESVDVALMGDIWKRSHAVVRKLGLDSNDSTSLEIYNVLRAKAADGTIATMTNTSYVGVVIDGECISLNKADILEDHKKSVAFADRSLAAMRNELLNEIERRYAASSVSAARLNDLMQWLRARV